MASEMARERDRDQRSSFGMEQTGKQKIKNAWNKTKERERKGIEQTLI
jgi:hypothetical protein